MDGEYSFWDPRAVWIRAGVTGEDKAKAPLIYPEADRYETP